MWCYQKPGFEALLLAELQRQQQCSQFCDTLLKTEGVAVPAHSCILSAISPYLSSALSSTPPPPAGQSRLLEFRALGACTLLRVVGLLYSGEMAGEGEEEKQKAVSAAAKLGIHGLVEVTRTERRHEEGEGRHAEVGLQTEAQMPEENEASCSRWRREVRDGSTFLWKEKQSGREIDTWTQTEELQVDTPPSAPPSHSTASFETIDMGAFQSLGQTDPHLPPPQIPYVPISLVYPLDENQSHQSSSAPVQESTAVGHTSVAVRGPPYTPIHPSLQVTPCALNPHGWWAGPQNGATAVAVAAEWEDDQVEQFHGNIPGYINYFLNPEKEEASPHRGRSRKRQGAGVRGAGRAGTGERGARRPRARTGGRGRGGFTQMVDVQEVGVSKLQKLFLLRWGMRASRTGQGGGAAGRKLYMKTRELLKPSKGCQRRRGRGKMWDVCSSGDVPPYSEVGASNTQRGRRSKLQLLNQSQNDFPVGRTQRLRAKPETSCASPPTQLYKVYSSSTSSPSFQPSPSSGLLAPAASYVSPVSSILHTTSLPPPPPQEEQPEHIERLLEEVMRGLDILPKINNNAPHSQPPLPTSSSKQQDQTTGNIETAPGFHESTQVVAVERGAGGSSSANSEVPILQQQGEGELNEMLEHFLLSFEQHTSRQEVGIGCQSCTEAPVRSCQINERQQNDEAETPARRSRPRTASACSASQKNTEVQLEKARAPPKTKRKRKKNEYLITTKRKKAGVRKPPSSNNAKTKIIYDLRDKQLQQMPVVKLERSHSLPFRVTLQGHSCQSLEVKSLPKAKTSSSAVKCHRDSWSDKNQPVLLSTKTYPIRSRCKKAQMDSAPFLEEPVVHKWLPSASQPRGRRGRPRKNGKPLSLSNGKSSTRPIQMQIVDKQLEENQERLEKQLTAQLQEEPEGPTRSGEKRGADYDEKISDDATVAKRLCFEEKAQPNSEMCAPSPQSPATEAEDVIDVETVSLASLGDCLQRQGQVEKTVWSQIKLRETEESLMGEEIESSDEIIDVDGDEEDDYWSRKVQTLSHFVKVKPFVLASSHPEGSLGSTGSCDDKDEDVDVVGGSSPVPDPVIFSWTESSRGEKEDRDEDVDVVGENADYASSAELTVTSEGEFVNRETEVLLH